MVKVSITYNPNRNHKRLLFLQKLTKKAKDRIAKTNFEKKEQSWNTHTT